MNVNKFSKILTVFLIVALSLTLISCTELGNTADLRAGSDEPLVLSDTDYADKSNWISFGGDNSKPVDIFIIYPTVAFVEDEADRPIVRLGNEMMTERANEWLRFHVGNITDSANLYMPYYRQMNGSEIPGLTREKFEEYANATPFQDVSAAFDYYLTNVNKGERPFIILGHSQGGYLSGKLTTTFLGNEKYYEHNKNHIATYAIGYSITNDSLSENPNLKFSQSATDTGVLLSWNSVSPREIQSGAYKEFLTCVPNAQVTNPISWRTDETSAKATDNKASLVINEDGTIDAVEGLADATVDNKNSVLVVDSVDESEYLSAFPNLGKYHGQDILFYHDSLKQNIIDRIAAFRADK